ncbi:Succinylglutamic semialdehyde dehydrogenase [Planctomycetales bacterium 10988]|nr:Succinylglutamic semialdehyde dehydrogenase [Planctomycetales bacterium 10988]
MFHIPALRWGKPYKSLEKQEIVHFATGEPIAEVSQANGGLLGRDIRKSFKAREALRKIPISDLIEMMKKAGDLYLNATLPIGEAEQTPEDFVKQQSATTGLPEHLCKGNMTKNHFVLHNMDKILDALTRGLDLNILSRGFGREDRGVTVSYQAQTNALGMVLPSNSPGVHTLWLPVIPLQIGLIIKPGSQEIWTPFRMAEAFFAAGIPREAISIYPGKTDMGAAVMTHCDRSMIFGGTNTIEKYKGDPRIQVHGPGFSKIILGEDEVDNWEQYLDMMVDSVYLNSGRGCINCSGIWAPRHTKEIAAAIAERIGPIEVKPPSDPDAALAAFTVPGAAEAIWGMLEKDMEQEGVTHMTESYGTRFIEEERYGYLRPVVAHCDSPEAAIASKEFMFPFVSVVECPQDQMIERMGYTLVCSAITNDTQFQSNLISATNIDRLNLGPIPTIKLDWLQPHEGNIIDFLFRARAFQMPEEKLTAAMA